MNRQLHDGACTRSSRSGRGSSARAATTTCSPRAGWLLKDKDGNPVDGLPVRSDRPGALLDSTNPEARALVLGQDPRQYLSARASTGPGSTRPSRIWFPTAPSTRSARATAIHNLFPLVHTKGVAEGSARDRPDFRNLILARAAYLGAQRSGAIFWTSDVQAYLGSAAAAGAGGPQHGGERDRL